MTRTEVVDAVDDVSFDVERGETLGIIGASGCGKSTLALTLVGLLARPAGRVTSGEARWKGGDLLASPPADLRRVRGSEIGIVFQDPQTALHPALPVIDQVAEAFLAHTPDLGRSEARRRATELLVSQGIPATAARADARPHRWSGGMRQRALIAIAIANDPDLLIADEPTTALDVTVQADILEILRRGGAGRRALLLITHDLGVIAELADRVAVMQSGRFVETGTVDDIFDRPRHPHTVELLANRPGLAAPVVDSPAVAGTTPARGVRGSSPPGERSPTPPTPGPNPAIADEPILRATGLTTVYPGGRHRRAVRAVQDVDLSLARGEIVGLVGESGCGKSTLARTLVGIERAAAGLVMIGDEIVAPARRGGAAGRAARRVQIVFQDPYASFNPRRRIRDAVAQPLRIHRLFEARGGWGAVDALLDRVGLPGSLGGSFPHELSGGERQRASIARALAVEPEVLVLDEPLTSLDVAIQAQILRLLASLRAELGVAMLLIAHDLAVVGETADRVAVMYMGRIVETGPAAAVFSAPRHPYTQALLSAAPATHPRGRGLAGRIAIPGEAPDAADPPPGCPFHPRCPRAADRCRTSRPELETSDAAHGGPGADAGDGRSAVAAACFYPAGG